MMSTPQLTFAQFDVECSDPTEEPYLVNYDAEDGWFCNCPDHYYRKHDCKHIKAAKSTIKNLVNDEVVVDDGQQLLEVEQNGGI